MNLLSINSLQTNQFAFHPIFDQEYLIDFHGPDLTEILWAFTLFKEKVVNEFYKLLPICQQGRWSEVVDLAHRLKPNFNIVGLTEYNDHLRAIEAADITSREKQSIIARTIMKLTMKMQSICQPIIDREIERMKIYLKTI